MSQSETAVSNFGLKMRRYTYLMNNGEYQIFKYSTSSTRDNRMDERESDVLQCALSTLNRLIGDWSFR